MQIPLKWQGLLIHYLYREDFEMKDITLGFKTVTLTVFTVKFYIPTSWLRINLSVLCHWHFKKLLIWQHFNCIAAERTIINSSGKVSVF